MSDPQFQKAYAEQNRADYITNATIATVIQIPLNLACSFMDHVMYPGQAALFLKVRIGCSLFVALTWLRFKLHCDPARDRFGIVWIMAPLVMILWLIYMAEDPYSPYYAGLNIILLGMGLLTPWAYWQNLLITLFVLIMYVAISLGAKKVQPAGFLINNITFLAITSAIVVSASMASARQRLREFTLRYELDKNKRELELTNHKLIELDKLKSRFFANVSHELRTPLTLLLGPLEVLIQKFNKTVDVSSQEMLQTMHANGMRLLKLINDLLELLSLIHI